VIEWAIESRSIRIVGMTQDKKNLSSSQRLGPPDGGDSIDVDLGVGGCKDVYSIVSKEDDPTESIASTKNS
jgi:hypothetical protein